MLQGQQGQPIPNAYEVNPMMIQMLGSVTPQQLPMLLFSNPQLVPTPYRKKFSKSALNLATYFTFGTITGIFANVQVKRISMKFLTLPVFIRLPIRLVIFALPFGAMYPKIQENYNSINQTLYKTHMKIKKLVKTGNMQDYFDVKQL